MAISQLNIILTNPHVVIQIRQSVLYRILDNKLCSTPYARHCPLFCLHFFSHPNNIFRVQAQPSIIPNHYLIIPAIFHSTTDNYHSALDYKDINIYYCVGLVTHCHQNYLRYH